MDAQNTAPGGQKNQLAGEYQLRGVMEMGSGFELSPDFSFQFYFSYGALDRSAEGTWTVKDNNIIFNSRVKHDKDFALLSSKKTADDSIIIKIIEPNAFFLSHVYCMLSSGEQKFEAMSNNQGEIWLPKKEVNSLSLAFEFSPERRSVFTVSDLSHNYFEFRFEPWVLDVVFNEFSLEIDGKGLKGKHPLLTGPLYNYVKTR